MFLGGAAEMWASWHEKIVPGVSGTGAGLCGGLAVLGLFGLLTGLPGVYEGIKALSGLDNRPPS